MVKRDSCTASLYKATPLLSILTRFSVVISKSDPSSSGEALNRIYEVDMVKLAQKGNCVTTYLTTKAVVNPELGVDRE